MTSIEYVPLDDVTDSLRALAPAVRQITGDGHVVTPQVVREAPPDERLAVIFDGTKRHDAYLTYLKVKSRVAFAAFDDTNVGEPFPYVSTMIQTDIGPVARGNASKVIKVAYGFDRHLHQQGELYWNSKSTSSAILGREGPHLRKVLQSIKKAGTFAGSLQNMASSQFTLVQGGEWRRPGCICPKHGCGEPAPNSKDAATKKTKGNAAKKGFFSRWLGG